MLLFIKYVFLLRPTLDIYVKLQFNGISLDSITDNLVPKVESVSVIRGYGNHAQESDYKPLNIPWYTQSEWQEWIAGQGR